MNLREKNVRRHMRERVQRGAALLDKAFPTWYQRINLKTLDLSSCEKCVCGQLAKHSRAKLSSRDYLGFNKNLMNRFAPRYYRANGIEHGHDHGFVTTEHASRFYGVSGAWNEIEKMWRREIRQRLRAAEESAV